ncbi:MAG: DUF1080 domain-containing protein, partial [Pirellulales bacterium]|nr:DUF1080 domain-containing protein [Pirellulales bacterium]
MSRWFIAAVALLVHVAVVRADDFENQSVSLFDGQSLSGWEGNQDWFRLEGNAIVAGSLKKKIPHHEFL